MASESMIQVRGIVKHFGSIRAVDGIDFEIHRGEIFGLLGPNGAGKTTTINLLTTLARPTAGIMIVNGRNVEKDPILVKQEIGVVPQHRSLDRDLSARENLLYHGKYFGLPRSVRRERADRLLELVGLSERADDAIETFSGGMLQRLLISRALVQEPVILFLDEPTVGLDPQTRRRIWEYVRMLRDSGMTMLLTTHYIEEADFLCDRVAIIDHGRVVALDTPRRLKSQIEGGDIITTTLETAPDGMVEALRSLELVYDLRQVRRNQWWELILQVDRGEELLVTIADIIRQHDLRLHSISLQEPTLEEVFINLTGHELRD